MTRFQPKPIIMDAWQWDGSWPFEIPEMLTKAVEGVSVSMAFIVTFQMRDRRDLAVNRNDWIVRGQRGQFWVVEGRDFTHLYEPVKTMIETYRDIPVGARFILNRYASTSSDDLVKIDDYSACDRVNRKEVFVMVPDRPVIHILEGETGEPNA